MSSDDLRETFFLECEDLLESMSEGLRLLQDDPRDTDTVNSVFRAVHSIKGGAGAFRMDDLVGFAHSFETVLDSLRAGNLSADAALMPVLFRAADHLADLVEAARGGGTADAERGEALLVELEAALPDTGDADEALDFAPMTLDLDLEPAPTTGTATFRIRFVPSADLYAHGNDPVILIRELSQIGDLEVSLDSTALPTLEALDPARAALRWTFTLTTEQGEPAIREIFEFVEDASTLEVEEAPEPDPVPPPTAPVEATLQSPVPEAPRATQSPAKPSGQTIRVNLDRVDRLVNVVGEMVIHQAMLTQAVERLSLPPGSDVLIGLEELKQLSRDMQESVMAIRAQPIKPLFQRMFRIVREAAEATGKRARLVTEGDATEVDKTVFEKLSDPLTHMIRNAVDHGLEAADKRDASGKSPEGTVTLSAGHRSGRVVITVADDGGGINRDKVRSIAFEKGLIAPDAELTPSEIDNLLFLPGFSTASEVSNLSGRGVGMDVVKSAIQALGGTVSIASQPGQGTTFTISLPLTLAVLDGMVVEVADQLMVVPITAIRETLRPSASDVQPLGEDDFVVAVRGAYLPVVDVAHALGFRQPSRDLDDKVVLLVESDEDCRAALLVDDIRDHCQVVIKSLEENFGQVPGVAAATVFGDGRVALILDTAALVERGGNSVTSDFSFERQALGHA